MHSLHSLAVALIALAIAAPAVQAQAGADDPFSIPTTAGSVLCRAIPASPADSAHVLIHFEDSVASFPERERVVAFDSLGLPLYLTLRAVASPREGAGVVHAFMIRFHPFSGGARSSLAAEGEPVSKENPQSAGKPADWIDLSPQEVERARKLAVYTWDRRCGKSD